MKGTDAGKKFNLFLAGRVLEALYCMSDNLKSFQQRLIK